MTSLRHLALSTLLSGCVASAAESARMPASAAEPMRAEPEPMTAPAEPVDEGACVTDADCGEPFKCSTPIGLCYEEKYGYVWDVSANGGQGAWSQPPTDVAGCGPDFVFWPKVNRCYDPQSGYTFNPARMQWEYFGDWYTAGQDEADEGEPSVPSVSMPMRI
jgi:hypothetical protein